jgi:hypothetical protein
MPQVYQTERETRKKVIKKKERKRGNKNEDKRK